MVAHSMIISTDDELREIRERSRKETGDKWYAHQNVIFAESTHVLKTRFSDFEATVLESHPLLADYIIPHETPKAVRVLRNHQDRRKIKLDKMAAMYIIVPFPCCEDAPTNVTSWNVRNMPIHNEYRTRLRESVRGLLVQAGFRSNRQCGFFRAHNKNEKVPLAEVLESLPISGHTHLPWQEMGFTHSH